MPESASPAKFHRYRFGWGPSSRMTNEAQSVNPQKLGATMSGAETNILAPLTSHALARMDAWWRGANYLNVGQICPSANPLLRQKRTVEHIKPRLLGHWGTSPGLNLIYVHMNRLIKRYDLDTIYM